MSLRVFSALLGFAALLWCNAPPARAQDEVDPAAEEAFFTGIALLEAGDPAGAIGKFDQALRIDKSLRRVLFYRARAWARLGDIDEARADLALYEALGLTESERSQLVELQKEVEERASQIGSAERPTSTPAVRPSQDDGRVPSDDLDGLGLLRSAEEALARSECASAAELAQQALTADNALTRAFLVKGLALECSNDLNRARALITTYAELRSGLPPDPVAESALARIDARLRGEAAAAGPLVGTEAAPLGNDAKIQGILGQTWGLSANRAVETRTRRMFVAGVGPADVGTLRMTVGGSNARVERAWVIGAEGLLWSRLRAFERSGLETTGWYVRSFSELYRAVERSAGEPDSSVGLDGPPEDPRGARSALAGLRRLEVRWSDGDGDVISLRLGRCTVTGDESGVHPNNAPCLELVGSSGRFPASKQVDKTTVAARRVEAPGRLRVDVSGGIGVGLGPAFWFETDLPNVALGGELGLDLNARAAVGGFVFGAGYALSVTGYTDGATSVGPGAESRLMGYVGLRDRPRQRSMTDVMLGFGLVPEVGGAAPVFSLRVLSQVRVGPFGRFFVSFEPYVAAGSDISFVPMRVAFGGLFGTRQRAVNER